jgi:sugar O-acyltransferase (sialic acid O-acetyltransferase NeuD family)
MDKPIVIFGIGSLGRLAHYYSTKEMGLKVIGFVVDNQFRTNETMLGLPILNWEENLEQHSIADIDMHVAIGYRSIKFRSAAYSRVRSVGYNLRSIISKSAYISGTATIGENSFIMPGVVIEPGVTLGTNNVVWSNSNICHDSNIGSHNFIASNATLGGEILMGDRNFLGFSSVIVQHVKVEDDVLIGANTLLSCDGKALGVYLGSPGRRVREIDPSVGVCV